MATGAAGATRSTGGRATGPGPGASARLLVVDLHAEVAQRIAEAFDAAGFQAGWCNHDPAEVLRMLRDMGPGLILVSGDLSSPHVTTLLARVQSGTGPDLPVALIGVELTDVAFVRSMRTGVVEILPAPFDPRLHVERVGALLAELPYREGVVAGLGAPGEIPALLSHLARARRTGGLHVGARDEAYAYFARGVLQGARFGTETAHAALGALSRYQGPWRFHEGEAEPQAASDLGSLGPFAVIEPEPSAMRVHAAAPAAPPRGADAVAAAGGRGLPARGDQAFDDALDQALDSVLEAAAAAQLQARAPPGFGASAAPAPANAPDAGAGGRPPASAPRHQGVRPSAPEAARASGTAAAPYGGPPQPLAALPPLPPQPLHAQAPAPLVGGYAAPTPATTPAFGALFGPPSPQPRPPTPSAPSAAPPPTMGAQPAPPPAASPAPGSAAPAIDPLAASTPILFVDDEVSVVTLLSEYFRRRGYPVTTARDGVEALQQLATKDFELVIADLNMPRLDGWGLLRLLREDFRTNEIPVALFSAHDDYRETLRLLHAGAKAFFSKSLRMSALEAQVRELAEPRRRFLRLVSSGAALTIDFGALGPQWVLRTLARLEFSGELDAKDGWATWMGWFEAGRLVQMTSLVGGTSTQGEAALRSFVTSRQSEGSLSTGARAAAPDEGFGGEPIVAVLARLVKTLNEEQVRMRDDQLARTKALIVNPDIYRLYVTVGAPAWMPAVRLLCEQNLPPSEVIARLQVKPQELAAIVKDLVRRGVVSLSTA